MSRYSVSKVKTYLKNPWDYYCKYVLGIRKPSKYQDALDRGTFYHSVAELSAKYEIDEAIKLAKERHKDFSQKAIDNALVAVDRYISTSGGFYKDMYPVDTEYKLEMADKDGAAEFNFIGYIDAVKADSNKHAWLVDYKTYSKKPREDEKVTDWQAWLYMYYFEKQTGVTPAGFIFDCVNPKAKITKNTIPAYKIKIPYSKKRANLIHDQFVNVVRILEQLPDEQEFFPFISSGDFESDYLEEFMTFSRLK